MLKRPGSLTHYGIQAVQPWNRLRGAVPKRAELANAGTLFYLVIRKRGLVE